MTRFQRASLSCFALFAAACAQQSGHTDINDELSLAEFATSEATAIASTADGTLYVAGWATDDPTGPGPHSVHWLVRRWNHVAWETIDDQPFGPPFSFVYPSGVAIANDGSVYVGGSVGSDPFEASEKIWLVRKWDGQQWSESDRYVSAELTSIAADDRGNIYASGFEHDVAPDGTTTSYNVVRINTGNGWSTASRTQVPIDDNDNWQTAALSPGGQMIGANPHHVGDMLSTGFDVPMPLGSPESLAYPTSMAVDISGHIYIGGVFAIHPNEAPDLGPDTAFLIEWNGSSWATLDTFSPDPGGLAACTALTIDSNGAVFGGGWHENDSEVLRWYVRKSSNGTVTSIEMPEVAAYITGLASDRHGHVYAAGGILSSSDYGQGRWVVHAVQ